MTAQYGEMTASFIRVLNLQRMLYENETRYIDALEHAWTSSIGLRRLSVEDGLMPPTSMEMNLPADGMERLESMDRTSGVFHGPPISHRNRGLEDAARSADKDPPDLMKLRVETAHLMTDVSFFLPGGPLWK